MTYYVGGTQQFAHSETDTNGNPISQQLGRWTVANPAIASITQSGLATWLAPGQTVVLFTIPSYHRSGGIPVVVHAPVPVSLSAVPASVTMLVGDVAKVTLSGLDAESHPITSLEIDSAGSSDESVAELVTLDGFEFLVVGKGAGSATITIRAGSATATIAVTVAVNDTVGISQGAADARYVNVAGDTMTGDLVLTAADVHARAFYGDASHLTGLPSSTPDWSDIANTPTTIEGYGITDFDSLGDARWAALAHTHAFSALTSVPTTIAGYGITDAYTKTASDARFAPMAVPWASLTSVPTTIGGYGITDLDSLGDARWAQLAHTHTFASLTSKPTTVAGYGITDFNTLGDARWSALVHTHAAADIISGVLATARLGTGTADAGTYLRGDGAWAAAPADAVPSVFGRTGAVVAAANDYTFAQLASKPTTIAGYGITDFNALGDARWLLQSAAGAANGVATLDSGGKIPSTQLPAIAVIDTFVVASQAAMLALTAQQGDVAVRTDLSETFILTASPASTLGNWQLLQSPTSPVSSVFGRTGTVSATSGDYSFAQIGSTPTTIAGYGITDFNSLGDARWAALAHTHAAADITSGTIATARLGSGSASGSTYLRGDQTWAALPSAPVTSVFGRTGVVAAAANDYTFAQLASKPTTIAGYGITDFNSLGDARWSLLAHTHTFASLTSKPTTISGFGITDFNSLGDARWAAIATTLAEYGITDAYTKTAADARYAPIAVPWSSLTGTPTTVAGYGITDFNSLGDARWAAIAHTHTFASLTSKPTTLAGYGITDAAPLASPGLTGTPTAPTAAFNDSSTQIATTQFVADNDRAMMEKYDCTTGGLASTYPRGMGLPTTSQAANTSGVLNLTRILLPKGLSISTIRLFSGSQSLSAGTHQWFALFDSSRNKLCVTADDTNTAWTGSTTKSLSVTGGPFVTTYSGWYYIGVLITVTTTMPTLLGVSAGAASLEGLAPITSGTADTGLTTPATCPATTIAITFTTKRFYAEVA